MKPMTSEKKNWGGKKQKNIIIIIEILHMKLKLDRNDEFIVLKWMEKKRKKKKKEKLDLLRKKG